MITTTNPSTGITATTAIEETSAAGVAALAMAAAAAAGEFGTTSRAWRADLLDRIAESLEHHRGQLVETAAQETGLATARLDGEVTRSAFQFRLFGEALREGSYLEAAIDHAGVIPTGPAPDVRRMLLPIGPVAVFGSSNFPFAFSVAGGDTASALAAGCPVIVKAHSAHPLTSQYSFMAIASALEAAGAPAGAFGIVYGQRAGAELVADPRIRAVGFTGSLGGGSALQRIIDARPQPIPLFAELSSLNPLILTSGAVAERGDRIADDLFASFTGSAGQLCTKPGVAFIPTGEHGDRLLARIGELVAGSQQQVLLNARIRDSFREIRDDLLAQSGATERARGAEVEGDQLAVAPTLVETTTQQLSPELTQEAFGPLLLAVRYADIAEIPAAVAEVPASLTATIHHGEDELPVAAWLSSELAPLVGRLVYNGYPTGVRVGWSQHHGGPWPATNSQHTSVGVTAIRRFLRPIAWQDADPTLLPEELRDDYHAIPRRVDGRLELPH